MDYMKTFNFWKMDKFFDQETRNELESLNPEIDWKEIEDRFYRDLEFGTGGLRGAMGAGTNRMNRYTVGKATTGLGTYLLDTYGITKCRNQGVVIGYDTRNDSCYFARITANILSSMGMKVYLHLHPSPTPQLSFSVRIRKAIAGVVITASHNPKEYNGYKIYDEDGCQLTPRKAEKVFTFVDAVKDFKSICFDENPDLLEIVDDTDAFIEAVIKERIVTDVSTKKNLHIVYTPLHGTGYIPIWNTLRMDGFDKIEIVEEQAQPDGNFPTVSSPNPEDADALESGILFAEKVGADIVLGTDPDSDRIGTAVKTEHGYQIMTGNQIGALLADFILTHRNLSVNKKPAIIKTIVTSEFGAEIAKKHGVTVFSTLTGFKFIGEKITQFETAKLHGDSKRDYDFMFGYEESYGYLSGFHSRDKDAVSAALLICEMAACLKEKRKTLVDRLNELYGQFGYYKDVLDSVALPGKDGMVKIAALMHELRSSDSPFPGTSEIVDYSSPVEAEPGFGTLPISDMLKYRLNDGSWIAVRPSGTEPKLKIYYGIKGTDEAEANQKLRCVQTIMKTKLKVYEDDRE